MLFAFSGCGLTWFYALLSSNCSSLIYISEIWTLYNLTTRNYRYFISGRDTTQFCATHLLLEIHLLRNEKFISFQSLILTLTNGLRFSLTIWGTNVLCVPKNFSENPMLKPITCECTVVFKRNQQCVIFAGKYSTRAGLIEMSIWGQFMVSLRPWCVKWKIPMLPTHTT